MQRHGAVVYILWRQNISLILDKSTGDIDIRTKNTKERGKWEEQGQWVGEDDEERGGEGDMYYIYIIIYSHDCTCTYICYPAPLPPPPQLAAQVTHPHSLYSLTARHPPPGQGSLPGRQLCWDALCPIPTTLSPRPHSWTEALCATSFTYSRRFVSPIIRA